MSFKRLIAFALAMGALVALAPSAVGATTTRDRPLAFACDAQGRIDLDRLSERARERYLYARALVGRDFAQPEVQRVA